MLDGVKGDKGLLPRPPEELAKIALLVRSAAGTSEARGDVVTVESMLFAEGFGIEGASDAASTPPVVAQGRIELARRWAPFAIGAALLASFAAVALKRRRRALSTVASSQLPPVPQPLALEASIRPALDSADLRSQAHSRATLDPATAALVLRFWLGTSKPEDMRETTSS